MLNIFSLTYLGLGATIGGGVFTLSGIAAKKAGSDVWISWIISGVVVLFSAFVYAELSTKIQKSGSSYIYTYIISGELIAFMTAWNMFMLYGGATGAQSQAFTSFFLGFMKHNEIYDYVPVFLSEAYVGNRRVYPIAAIFIALSAFVITLGSKKSDITNRIITLGKILLIVLLNYVSFQHQDPKYFKEPINQPLEKKFEGILEGATLTYFGFTAFETGSTMTAEAINPKRDIPRAIIFTVILCIILYTVTSVSVLGIGIAEASVHHDADTALAIAYKLIGVSWMAQVVYVAAMLGVSACSIANLMV